MSITVIKPQELAGLCNEGKKIDLIDVRTPVEFREVHVEIARNVPLDQLDPATLMQARNGSANEPLYVICRSGNRGQAETQRSHIVWCSCICTTRKKVAGLTKTC